jgi:hypothetical protein
MKEDRKRMAGDPAIRTRYPQYIGKYDEAAYAERNRDRYEYR